MIFRQYNQVLRGTKTQTRRGLHKGDVLRHTDDGQMCIYDTDAARVRYQVGKTYPVIPKMFQPAIIWCPDHPCYGIDIIEPGDHHYQMAKDGTWPWQGQGYIKARIQITALDVQHVQDISHEDAVAEGVEGIWEYQVLWESINVKSRKYRWTSNPMVAVISFEVVK